VADFSMQQAHELVERMKGRMHHCKPCQRMVVSSRSDMETLVLDGWKIESLDPYLLDVGLVKHAPDCDGGRDPFYPWASRLDLERVREYVAAQPYPFSLADLEELTRG